MLGSERSYQGQTCLRFNKDNLMARVGPEHYEQALKRKHARKMDLTGRPMKGFVFVAPEGIKTKKSLTPWVQMSLDFVASLEPK